MRGLKGAFAHGATCSVSPFGGPGHQPRPKEAKPATSSPPPHIRRPSRHLEPICRMLVPTLGRFWCPPRPAEGVMYMLAGVSLSQGSSGPKKRTRPKRGGWQMTSACLQGSPAGRRWVGGRPRHPSWGCGVLTGGDFPKPQHKSTENLRLTVFLKKRCRIWLLARPRHHDAASGSLPLCPATLRNSQLQSTCARIRRE